MESLDEGRLLLGGLAFPEGPRWRQGQLWFTDQHAHEVVRVDLEGRRDTVVANMDDRPGGLGFLPDGTPLVVSMQARQVLRITPSGLELHADLSALASFHCNDMLVDDQGRAYVGNFGYDLDAGEAPRPAEIILLQPDGQARIVSQDEVIFPNGMALTPDRQTLVVAETFGARIGAFDVLSDGSLSGYRIWADLDGAQPDGLCLDAEGAVWFACTRSGRVYRVTAEGHEVAYAQPRTTPYACMLCGPERRHLAVLCSTTHVPEEAARLRTGTIEVFPVEVPGAGLP
ncbi:MAG: SMP-30/gluconolactonase/LRE family protein [Myxococcota bacterium]